MSETDKYAKCNGMNLCMAKVFLRILFTFLVLLLVYLSIEYDWKFKCHLNLDIQVQKLAEVFHGAIVIWIKRWNW